MADVNGVNSSNPLGPMQGRPRSIRITSSDPNRIQTVPSADTISFSQAAQRMGQANPGGLTAPVTYGISGLQATTPAAALEALAQRVPPAARQMLAGRVDQPMDYRSGEVKSAGGMPFYTNPAMANGVATSTSVARLGGSLDTNA